MVQSGDDQGVLGGGEEHIRENMATVLLGWVPQKQTLRVNVKLICQKMFLGKISREMKRWDVAGKSGEAKSPGRSLVQCHRRSSGDRVCHISVLSQSGPGNWGMHIPELIALLPPKRRSR